MARLAAVSDAAPAMVVGLAVIGGSLRSQDIGCRSSDGAGGSGSKWSQRRAAERDSA